MTKTSKKPDDPRCPWCLSTPLYRQYHDEEWGRPVTDSTQLLELINLEGAQAGLSWITVLNKRAHYRKVFHGFDPERNARITDARVEKLLLDAGIIRHRGKIEAVRGNAQAWLAMQEAGEDFSTFVWSFVNHKALRHKRASMAEVPGKTDTSDAMSKALKKRGFKFVGSTICYAFMQAAGLVNDHVISCPSHRVCANEAKSLKF